MESLTSGTLAGNGTFRCESCDYVVALATADELPPCPRCGGESFARASLFTEELEAAAAEGPETPRWLASVREEIAERGQYLAYEADEGLEVFCLTGEWTRVGRSLAADIRFDDPTVSRRHALIVRQPDGVRVLDDRSLNGVFVNGERVEWSPLGDGDEVLVGRHHLYFVDVSEVGAAVSGMRDEAATLG